MALSKVQIANMALAEVPASRISGLDEDSIEAGHVRVHYQPSLELLLEAHDWDFAIKRIVLAAVANDRPDEHGSAFQLPADVASPRRLVPSATAAGLVAPGVPSVRSAFSAGLDEMLTIYPYTIAAGKLYTDLDGATLEYVSNNVSESAFPALFARALGLELATRLVSPIKQDTKRQDYIRGMAEVARERAIADNMNRQPRQQYGFASEEARARALDY
ncbi:MAG TPA: hypothetical protein VF655_00175 [Allosphingosinicella sp.]|jgi:hypothetical protein